MEITGKQIIVTGGAGFIGSELCRQLVERGASVIVIDNLVNGKIENLSEVDESQILFKQCDIREQERVGKLMQGAEVVFHLATLGVRHSIHSPVENHMVNAGGTLGLLTEARKAGVKRFVHVSTSEVYGTGITVPMNEEHPTFPMTVYGASKLAGEGYARAFYRTYEYPTVVIRPFNTYGPRSHHEGDSGEVIPKMMLRAMADKPLVVFGDGEQTRDFIYVEDCAHGILETGLCDAAIGETINIGSGKEITINRLAELIKKAVGKAEIEVVHEKQRPGDTLRLYADISCAKDLIGFKPSVRMEEGLEKLHAWYQAQGKSAENLLKHEKVHNWKMNG